MAGVIIVGSTGSFGSEFAKNVALDGKDLILVGRDEGKLSEQERELRAINPNIHISYMVCDLMDEQAPDTIMRILEVSTIKPNELIYAAGVSEFSDVETTSDETIQRINHINLTMPEILTKRFAEFLEENGMNNQGRIMITTGTAGLTQNNFNPYYGASRTAFLDVSSALIENLDRRGISFTNFIPGLSRNRAAEAEFGQELTDPRLASPQKICQNAYLAMQNGKEYYIGVASLMERHIWAETYRHLFIPFNTHEGRSRDISFRFRQSLSNRVFRLFGNMPQNMRQEYIDALNNGDRLKILRLRAEYLASRIRRPRLEETPSPTLEPSHFDYEDDNDSLGETEFPSHILIQDDDLTPQKALEQLVGEYREDPVERSVESSLDYLLRLYGLKDKDNYSTQSGGTLSIAGKDILEGNVPSDYEKSYGRRLTDMFFNANEKVKEVYTGIASGKYKELIGKFDDDKLLKLVHLAYTLGIELDERNTSQMLTILNGLVDFEFGKTNNAFGLNKDDTGIILLLLKKCTSKENKREDTNKVLRILQKMEHGRGIITNSDFVQLILQGDFHYSDRDQKDRTIGTNGRINREDYNVLLEYGRKEITKAIIEDTDLSKENSNFSFEGVRQAVKDNAQNLTLD